MSAKGGGRGVVLVSGGMDSAVTAAMAREECGFLGFLHVRYGGRTQAREERAFRGLSSSRWP